MFSFEHYLSPPSAIEGEPLYQGLRYQTLRYVTDCGSRDTVGRAITEVCGMYINTWGHLNYNTWHIEHSGIKLMFKSKYSSAVAAIAAAPYDLISLMGACCCLAVTPWWNRCFSGQLKKSKTQKAGRVCWNMQRVFMYDNLYTQILVHLTNGSGPLDWQ